MDVMKIFVTLMIVLPYIWFILMGKSAAKKKEKIFNKLLKQEQLTLTSKEMWNNSIIGINETKKIMLFVKLKDAQKDFFSINLNDVKSCQINKVKREFKKDKKNEFELQKLDLELSFISKKPNAILNFYDINDSFSQDFEMQRVEKWMALIQQNIQKQVFNKSIGLTTTPDFGLETTNNIEVKIPW